MIDSYYMKLCETIKTCLFIEGINTCYLSDLFIDINNFAGKYDYLWVLDNL